MQVILRISYILLSSYGMYAVIQEAASTVFYGWNALLISLLFLLNVLLSLAVSNRELRICWVFIRNVTNWRFLYLYAGRNNIYLVFRLTVIVGTVYLYAYFFSFDRKAFTALVASLGLVISDTPTIRKHAWISKNKSFLKRSLAAVGIVILGGWRIYRWFALIGLYIGNDALLLPNFMSIEGQFARHQHWLASAALPVILVYQTVSPNGLPSYTTSFYIFILLLFLCPNSPSRSIKKMRTMMICALGALLELFLFGMGIKFFALCFIAGMYVIFLA